MKDFDTIFWDWMKDQGGELRGSKLEKRQAFAQLAAALQAEGYTRTQVTAKVNIIVGYCTNDSSRKYKKWVDLTKNLLNLGIADAFGDTEFKKVEIVQKPETVESSPEVAEVAVPMGEDIDKALLGEPLQVHYDMEFRKLLGFKDE